MNIEYALTLAPEGRQDALEFIWYQLSGGLKNFCRKQVYNFKAYFEADDLLSMTMEFWFMKYPHHKLYEVYKAREGLNKRLMYILWLLKKVAKHRALDEVNRCTHGRRKVEAQRPSDMLSLDYLFNSKNSTLGDASDDLGCLSIPERCAIVDIENKMDAETLFNFVKEAFAQICRTTNIDYAVVLNELLQGTPTHRAFKKGNSDLSEGRHSQLMKRIKRATLGGLSHVNTTYNKNIVSLSTHMQ